MPGSSPFDPPPPVDEARGSVRGRASLLPLVVGTLLDGDRPEPARSHARVPRRSGAQLLVDVEAALARRPVLPRRGAPYAVAAGLALALAIAVPLAYLAAVAAFFAVAAVCALLALEGATALGIAVPAAIALVSVSAGAVAMTPLLGLLRPRLPYREESSLHEGNEPLLVGLVDALSKAIGVRRPEHIELRPGADAALVFVGHAIGDGFGGFARRRSLRIGATLLETLSVAELVAVIAHELAHARQGTARRVTLFAHDAALWIGAAANPVDDDDDGLIARARRVVHLVALLPVALFARAADVLVMALAREQERDADAVSAAVVGAAHLGSALSRACAARVTVDAVLADADHGGPCVDDLARFAGTMANRMSAAQKSGLSRLPTRDGAGIVHPPLEDRLRELPHVVVEPDALPVAPAADLGRDLRALSKRATASLWRSRLLSPRIVDTDKALTGSARGAPIVTRGVPPFLR